MCKYFEIYMCTFGILMSNLYFHIGNLSEQTHFSFTGLKEIKTFDQGPLVIQYRLGIERLESNQEEKAMGVLAGSRLNYEPAVSQVARQCC